MKKIKFVIYIFMLLIGFSILFANSIKASELSGIKQMEEILKEKKETGEVKLPGYVIGEDDGELSGDEESWKAHKAIYDRLLEREKIVSQYIEPNPNIEIVENKTNTNINSIVKNNTIYIVLFIFAIVLFYIVSMVFKNKKILFFEIVVVIVFIIIMNNNLYKQKNNNEISNEEKKTIRYLNSEIEDKKLDNFANEYKTKYIDKYNEREVDLSKVINDYIIKCYYCVKRKANVQELYTEDLEVLNCFEGKRHKYDFTYESRYVDILKWEKIDDWKVVNNILTKESMKGIYDSLTDEDIENFNNGTFLDKLVKSINKNIKSKEDFDAYSIIPYDYFRIYRLDVTPLYQCKYWYLEKGEDLTLALPYGATFKYEIAKLEKKDIEKIENVEIKKIEFDPENEKTMFVYYIDSNGKKQGVFTTIYETGLYNKYKIIDAIKYGNIDMYTKTINDLDEDTNKNREEIGKIIRTAGIKRRKRELNRFTDSFIDKYGINGVLNITNIDYIDTIRDITFDLIDEQKRLRNKYLCDIKYLSSKGHNIAIFKLKWKDNKVDDIEYYIAQKIK